jgi:DNA polymerase-3 subunit alpha
VISTAPLTDLVPVQRGGDDTTTQYAMDPVVDVGLVKMDFLGLATLTIIQKTLDQVRENHGVDIDVHSLPLDDPATYELLAQGDTFAVFQLESEGMRRLLRQFHPQTFEHIISLLALYRKPTSSAPAGTSGSRSSTCTRTWRRCWRKRSA